MSSEKNPRLSKSTEKNLGYLITIFLVVALFYISILGMDKLAELLLSFVSSGLILLMVYAYKLITTPETSVKDNEPTIKDDKLTTILEEIKGLRAEVESISERKTKDSKSKNKSK